MPGYTCAYSTRPNCGILRRHFEGVVPDEVVALPGQHRGPRHFGVQVRARQRHPDDGTLGPRILRGGRGVQRQHGFAFGKKESIAAAASDKPDARIGLPLVRFKHQGKVSVTLCSPGGQRHGGGNGRTGRSHGARGMSEGGRSATTMPHRWSPAATRPARFVSLTGLDPTHDDSISRVPPTYSIQVERDAERHKTFPRPRGVRDGSDSLQLRVKNK